MNSYYHSIQSRHQDLISIVLIYNNITRQTKKKWNFRF